MSEQGFKQSRLDGRRRGTNGEKRAKRSDAMTLGLRAFEKISAVEGVILTDQMRRDARTLSDKRVSHARKK